MSNVSGYYTTPVTSVPTPPANAYQATSTPSQASTGASPVMSTESWIPSSQSDPYLAGMRTSGSAMASMTNASKVATMARWNHMLSARSVAAKAAGNAARVAGRASSMTKMTQQMSNAKSVAAKSQLTKGVNVGVGGAVRSTFFSLGNVARAIGSSALVAVPMALVTNFLDWRMGKINDKQRNTLMVADSIGYTATGASATLIGGAVGSTFLGPGVGTVVGIAAGFGLGWVYEKYIRPKWGQMVGNAMYPTTSTPAPTPTPTPTRTPTPTPQPPVITDPLEPK